MLQSLRSKVAVVMLSAGLLVGTVAPLAAAPGVKTASGGQTHPFHCYKDGAYYPLGTRLAAGPLSYMQCEMGRVEDVLGYPRFEPVWQVYPKT